MWQYLVDLIQMILVEVQSVDMFLQMYLAIAPLRG